MQSFWYEKRYGCVAFILLLVFFWSQSGLVCAAQTQDMVLEDAVEMTIGEADKVQPIYFWGGLKWYVHDKTLYIFGKGEMEEANKEEYPWYECRDTFDKIVIDEGVKSIAAQAFRAYGVKTVELPKSLEKIGKYAFYSCRYLQEITIPQGVESIGEYTFSYCDALSKVTLNNGLKRIGGYAFRLSGITSLEAPASLEDIGEYAFEHCFSLKSVILDAKMTKISKYAFRGCSLLESVVLGQSITEIESAVFYSCWSLKEIEWSKNLEIVGRLAFSGCKALTTVVLPESVRELRKNAFELCDELTSVVVGKNCEKIEYNFDSCPKLTEVKVYSTKVVYDDWIIFYNSPTTLYGWEDSSTQILAQKKNIPFVAFSELEAPVTRKIINIVSGVHVYWEEVPEAKTYILYRCDTKDGMYTPIKEELKATHYIDTSVASGRTYYYKVMAQIKKTQSKLSKAQGITYVGTPDITSRINKAAGIQLGWNKINGATGYAIYRKSYAGNDAWVRVATISGNSTFTWTDEAVKANNGSVYKYTVRALAGSDKKTLSGCRNAGRTMVRLASRVLNSAEKTGSTSIKCEWTTSSAVTGYEVRFMVGDSVIKTVTIGNYKTGVKTFTGLTKGKKYKVQVRSYKKVDGVGSFYSAWSVAKYVQL